MQLLHDFFDQHWHRWAHRVAVDIPPGRGRSSRVQLTYAELAERSARITRRLELDVSREAVVVLMLPRTSVWAYAAQLGVLRAGAAYTSIDPAWPDERVKEIVTDSRPAAVITDQDGVRRARNLGVDAARAINVDGPAIGERAPAAPPTSALWLTPGTLAYLIYTSGTTGHPKGVMIEHRAIANLVASDLAEFGLSETARVGHGSSHAYDSSVEEIWLAWAAGGTVVVLDDDVVRSGPDLIPWLVRERVTVLCPPPTLLRTMGGHEAAASLPELQLLYVGGEALPADVAAVWSVGRRLVNGYGPTECTVTSLRADILPGDTIAIGRPVAGLEAWVLDSGLEEVPDTVGPCPEPVEGELCISGIGLARGYWDAPDMTASKFPRHPRLGRIYRTGDRVHRDASGLFFYHGRIDAQVKLRGHRIELEEIETHVARCTGVRAAACRVEVHGTGQTLVAFVVPTDQDAPPSFQDIRAALGRTLPAHMIPSRIQLIGALPATTGGKLDRAALPAVDAASAAGNAGFVPIENQTESLIEATVRSVLRHPGALSAADDFFVDLGGDSLRAAELVTALRQHPATQSITVRDVYEAPTIRAMAERARPLTVAGAAADRRAPAGRGQRLLATAIETMWIISELWIAAILSYAIVLEWLPRAIVGLGLIPFLLLAPVFIVTGIVAYTVAALAAVVLTKRLLIGRYVAAEAPVWGGLHIKNWIVQQTARLVPWSLLAGGEFHSMALRALGARIGRRVHIHRGVDLAQGGWDLLQIGDDVTLGQDAELRLVELDAGRIIVAPIVLGNHVTLETRAGAGENTRLEDGAYLAAHSALAPGHIVPAGQRWDGVPAAPAGAAPESSRMTRPGRVLTPLQYSVALVCANFALAIIVAAPIEIASISLVILNRSNASAIVAWLTSPRWETPPLAMVAALAVAAGPITLIWLALIVRALGRVVPGVISRWSFGYIRIWMKTGLVESAGNWLSGTLLWPAWLRASGMSVGGDCEISTIIDVVPEQITIGRTCFLADGIYLGGPLVHRGTVTVRPTRLEDGAFLGNHAVIRGGTTVADGVLIGISTVPDARAGVAGTSWFGHPPFELARKPAAGLDRRVTHEPSAIRYVNRLFWECLRFAIPLGPVAMLFAWIAGIDITARHVTLPIVTAIAPLLTVLAAAVVCLFVIALKWMLLGRVSPGEHPLWSCWCSRWDFLYVVWTQLARPLLVGFEGTLMLNWYLRAMGARIGRRVVLGRGFAQMVDPDMLTIGDEATVQGLFQAHTFEDRVLKIDRVRIGRRATVGSAVVLLSGADVGDGATVAAHSVVMKRERLTPGRSYNGYPTREG